MKKLTAQRDGARVSEILPDETLKSNILISGPTRSEKDTIAFDLLAESWASERPPFVITAMDTADQFRSRFNAFSPPNRRVEDLYVIDCTESGQNEDATGTPTCTSATPADLTGVGICLSKGYDEFGTTGGRVILLDNLSTFLVYSDVDRIFRFITAINNRVTEFGDITVQLLDTDAIDTMDKNRLTQLFSTVIEVREDEGKTLFRVQGGTETTWAEYPSQGETR
ncbi:DUF7504 family protein [Halorientalis salina]|uniref:DUF7504 family protein n=1 Tax=Halorientalis salina TaxID=2932266 RepID=UPI0010AD49AA|nr:hypothetical protein [Halorientalis salina]